MLAWWIELLPLFVVRWLALRYCERVPFDREGNARVAALARPDVLVRVPQPKPAPAEMPPRPGCKNLSGCVCERENLAAARARSSSTLP